MSYQSTVLIVKNKKTIVQDLSNTKPLDLEQKLLEILMVFLDNSNTQVLTCSLVTPTWDVFDFWIFILNSFCFNIPPEFRRRATKYLLAASRLPFKLRKQTTGTLLFWGVCVLKSNECVEYRFTHLQTKEERFLKLSLVGEKSWNKRINALQNRGVKEEENIEKHNISNLELKELFKS
jgi:hypothetical protein